ncbi:hypothetical protein CA13_21900 [Planctomycetes bacterium CA13]|uniref:Uncharacterized protein n=1 Tax=Novipirellula herctigrandis TaxID=2527986 RepID=A0A5C5Z0A8_9BACT|nr:hypothetical protein CA13_21900 [Planctomycetes bacterium CA13]
MNRLLAGLYVTLMLLLAFANSATANRLVSLNRGEASIDWQACLSRYGLNWDRVSNRWEDAPYTGNGNVGFLFSQAKGTAGNAISIYAGRHDYYDHRLPDDGKERLWIYRSRFSRGHFDLTSQGEIKAVGLRLSLGNADLTSAITTSVGSHSKSLNFVPFKTIACSVSMARPLVWQSTNMIRGSEQ